MIFYSILFSLNAPSENMYIWMFDLLLKTLKKTKTITEKDRYYILADSETKDELINLDLLNDIVQCIDIPKPKSLLEGMLWKYKLHMCIELEGKSCMYLDVDMLSTRKFEIEIPTDSFYILSEGSSDNSDYCGGAGWKLNLQQGISAGFFGFTFGTKVKRVFESILELAEKTKETFYTIEQPFFNKCIENASYTLFDTSTVSFNAHNNLEDCFFISYAGSPGNGECHWQKGIQLYSNYCQ